MTTLYGISNCDTVKKAQRWLADNHVEYRFHDVRKDGLSEAQVRQWIDALGWETLVNKRSTTWKGLDAATREQLDAASVIPLILEQPTLIKRPLLEHGTHIGVGFKDSDYAALFL